MRIAKCDHCGKELETVYQISAQKVSLNGLIIHSHRCDDYNLTLGNIDLCSSCLAEAVEKFITEKHNPKFVSAKLNENTATQNKDEELPWVEAKEPIKKTESKKKSQKVASRSRIVKSDPMEKYGKMYALRKNGWTWEQIADEFAAAGSGKRFADGYNYYIKSHPEAIEQWEGGYRRCQKES